jgi:hypothetical protein
MQCGGKVRLPDWKEGDYLERVVTYFYKRDKNKKILKHFTTIPTDFIINEKWEEITPVASVKSIIVQYVTCPRCNADAILDDYEITTKRICDKCGGDFEIGNLNSDVVIGTDGEKYKLRKII